VSTKDDAAVVKAAMVEAVAEVSDQLCSMGARLDQIEAAFRDWRARGRDRTPVRLGECIADLSVFDPTADPMGRTE
jgi:hypothetical protein